MTKLATKEEQKIKDIEVLIKVFENKLIPNLQGKADNNPDERMRAFQNGKIDLAKDFCVLIKDILK